MGFGDVWFNSNNGEKVNIYNFSDNIDKNSLSENSEWLKILSIFDQNGDTKLDSNEFSSLLHELEINATTNLDYILEDKEIEKFLTQKRILNNEYKALKDFGITLDGFKSFLSKVFNPESDNNAEGTYDNTKRAVNTSSWENFKKNNRVKKVNIGGSTVHACGWSNFSKSPQIWIDLQSCMIQAAEEMDLTLIYNDVNRSIAVSNKAHEKKPNIAAEGGKSPHNYGVAADICLFANGKIVNFDSDLFKKFANRVKELSNNKIAWGGDWNKTNEKHHFELKDWKVLRDNNELKLIS